MKMGLKNILDFMNYYGIEYNKLKTVHIAGTNGKGSNSNIISQVMTANGYKTGMFTSPHLERFNERIKIDNIEITDDDLSGYIKYFKEGIEKFNCTFFEANTAIAFKYFLDKEVDIAVIEVGLGGRLDATNIITPLVSVITGIDYDHQKQLGSSIVQIAREKAGIIKPGVPVVANFRRKPVQKVLRSVTKKKKSKLIIVKRSEYKFTNSKNGLFLEFNFKGNKLRPQINLKGRYQRDNLRTALTALKIISRKFNIDPFKTASALSSIYIKGRMETISDEPKVIIDAAHNIEGLSFLKNELETSRCNTVHLVLGMVKDKDYEKALKYIAQFKAKKYFVEAGNKRMLDTVTMKNCRYLKNDRSAGYFRTPKEGYDAAVRSYRKGDVIIAAGSHFVLGDLLTEVKKI